MIDLIREYLSKDRYRPEPEIQEYTIIGDFANAISIIHSAAKEYMDLYNQISIYEIKNQFYDTYTVWVTNRNSKNLDNAWAWYFDIDPNSLSEHYINLCLVQLREGISKVLGEQKIKSIKYKNENL